MNLTTFDTKTVSTTAIPDGVVISAAAAAPPSPLKPLAPFPAIV
jgi:hypothetical protein